jgi:small conductance mechanosensitive channel
MPPSLLLQAASAPVAEQSWLDNTAVSMTVTTLTQIVKVLVILIGGWIIAGWVGRLVVGALDRTKIDRTLSIFFGKAVRWALITGAVIGCLGVFGIQTTSFAAVLGAAGLAIGLAFQGTLSNLAAGVMLLVFRPFKVGDLVKAAGQVGTVQEIDLFSTALDTPDNRRIIIPNSKISGDIIENSTFHLARRIELTVPVKYGADVNLTREVLLEAVQRVKGQAQHLAAQAFLTEYGASLTWKVAVWAPTTDVAAVTEAAIQAVKEAVDSAGIGVHGEKPA